MKSYGKNELAEEMKFYLNHVSEINVNIETSLNDGKVIVKVPTTKMLSELELVKLETGKFIENCNGWKITSTRGINPTEITIRQDESHGKHIHII